MGTFTIAQTQDSKNLYLNPDGNGCNIDFTPEGEANNWECVDDPKILPDDEIGIRELLNELFKDAYNILTAENGEKAIKFLNEETLQFRFIFFPYIIQN